ncbi:MAG: extracellular solute-binding protein [Eubacteriales bacterium]|nr:extracellular solute-binding protein [Eubacteriales bacterium]
MLKKSLSLIFAVLLIMTAFASCVGNESGNSSAEESKSIQSGISEETSDNDETTADTSEGFKYATSKYFGTTVKILTVNSERHTYGELQYVPYDEDDEQKSSAINVAVKARNDYIYENYGITIKTRTEKYPTDVIYNEIMTNIADYDLVCDSVDRMVIKVLESLFISLDDYIDLDDSWWDKDAIDDLSLDGVKHFLVSGDCMLTDVDHIYLTLFNKKLYNQNTDIVSEYGDLYQLVKDYKFTLDAYTEMCKAVSVADTDGNWSFDATYGNLSHSYGATIMVNGGGVSTVTKKAESGLRCTVMDQHSQNVFDKVYELMSNRQITQRAELIIGQGSKPSTYGFSELGEMFTSGRGLFYNTTVSSISGLKTSEDELDFDFGVLPIPLYNEQQDSYYCAVNRYQSSVIGIPLSNVDNVEASVFLLNALGYLNTSMPGNVISSYYEITLKLQGSDTQDDCDMLDLVFKSKFYDLGTIFTFGSLMGLYGGVINNATTNNLTSTFESYQNGIEQAMEDTYQTYLDSLL